MDTIDTRDAMRRIRQCRDDYDGILTKPVMLTQIYTTWDIALMK